MLNSISSNVAKSFSPGIVFVVPSLHFHAVCGFVVNFRVFVPGSGSVPTQCIKLRFLSCDKGSTGVYSPCCEDAYRPLDSALSFPDWIMMRGWPRTTADLPSRAVTNIAVGLGWADLRGVFVSVKSLPLLGVYHSR